MFHTLILCLSSTYQPLGPTNLPSGTLGTTILPCLTLGATFFLCLSSTWHPILNLRKPNWCQPTAWNLEVAASRVDADIIVTDLELPGLRSQLAMMLVGGAIMQTSLLMGGNGRLLCYKRLTRTPKWVHMTTAFKQEFPGAAAVISSLAAIMPHHTSIK